MLMWPVLVVLSLFLGCATSGGPLVTVLAAPQGIKPDLAAQLERGNSLFAARDWPGAEQAFRQTIASDGAFAEAHYNLAVTLDRMGRQAEAKKHYIEAANLAPGNKVIWDSPPLRGRSGGLTHDVERKSYQDPSYRGF
ncbi:MAG TPA: tetratricopeptide repeat protein [Nitrospira sp.]|nr:tetratricopeptide repeat protein [Nitrospira sp.]